MAQGEVVWKRKDHVTVCKWKDKREVLTISNMHQVEMEEVRNRNGKVSVKPNIVIDYNGKMHGVDKSDQIKSYYSALRTTIRWPKKNCYSFIRCNASQCTCAVLFCNLFQYEEPCIQRKGDKISSSCKIAE